MSTDVLFEFFPFSRLYTDGRVERFSGEDFLPPSVDPVTGVESKDVTISSDPNLSARLYLPKTAKTENKLPLLVYFHGGAFIICSAFNATYHNYLNSLSSQANFIIVSVNYRRAPENPLPAAYEDSWLALKWVASSSSIIEYQDPWLKDYADYNKVYFGGDSAGGNLAHQMALKLGIQNLKGLNLNGIFLSCPYFWGKEPIGNEASNPELKKVLDKLGLFLYQNTTGLDDPLLNPEMDPNLSSLGCNRVLVFVAENDPLKDRGWYYNESLMKTNWKGKIDVVEYKEENHVFNLNDPDTENSRLMMKILCSFLNNEGLDA